MQEYPTKRNRTTEYLVFSVIEIFLFGLPGIIPMYYSIKYFQATIRQDSEEMDMREHQARLALWGIIMFVGIIALIMAAALYLGLIPMPEQSAI